MNVKTILMAVFMAFGVLFTAHSQDFEVQIYNGTDGSAMLGCTFHVQVNFGECQASGNCQVTNSATNQSNTNFFVTLQGMSPDDVVCSVDFHEVPGPLATLNNNPCPSTPSMSYPTSCGVATVTLDPYGGSTGNGLLTIVY